MCSAAPQGLLHHWLATCLVKLSGTVTSDLPVYELTINLALEDLTVTSVKDT